MIIGGLLVAIVVFGMCVIGASVAVVMAGVLERLGRLERIVAALLAAGEETSE